MWLLLHRPWLLLNFSSLNSILSQGTSTRKPRINPALVAAQAAGTAPTSSQKRPRSANSLKKKRRPPRLSNVDRSSAQTREVTPRFILALFWPSLLSDWNISTWSKISGFITSRQPFFSLPLSWSSLWIVSARCYEHTNKKKCTI